MPTTEVVRKQQREVLHGNESHHSFRTSTVTMSCSVEDTQAGGAISCGRNGLISKCIMIIDVDVKAVYSTCRDHASVVSPEWTLGSPGVGPCVLSDRQCWSPVSSQANTSIIFDYC